MRTSMQVLLTKRKETKNKVKYANSVHHTYFDTKAVVRAFGFLPQHLTVVLELPTDGQVSER